MGYERLYREEKTSAPLSDSRQIRPPKRKRTTVPNCGNKPATTKTGV